VSEDDCAPSISATISTATSLAPNLDGRQVSLELMKRLSLEPVKPIMTETVMAATVEAACTTTIISDPEAPLICTSEDAGGEDAQQKMQVVSDPLVLVPLNVSMPAEPPHSLQNCCTTSLE
jgi:hypothetical protein